LTVYGDGSQTRSLCYVADLVEGIFRTLLSDLTGPTNLGNPEEISILQLAEAIIRVTQSKSAISFEALPVDDPRRRQPDITAARDKLGWSAQVSLEAGLAKTLPYFRSSLQKGSPLSTALKENQ
jgi:dTDP-glucose 4,6-dehydratase